jgi:hypothetical protein
MRDADHSSLSSADVKNEELYSSPPLVTAWRSGTALLYVPSVHPVSWDLFIAFYGSQY